jgi:hypothetical protein
MGSTFGGNAAVAPPLTLNSEWVILGEGDADCNFFRKLTTKRGGFPNFDIFPVNGRPKYEDLLKAIRADQENFQRLKGVLVTADSANKPSDVFDDLCEQIRRTGGYGVPNGLLELGTGAGHPPLAIMLLPDEATPGGLESLLVREIELREQWLRACVETYLRCDRIQTMTWAAEKRDKAIFHCMIAATNEDDPSKAASWVFKDPKPVIAVEAHCFDDVERRIKAFCVAAEALAS